MKQIITFLMLLISIALFANDFSFKIETEQGCNSLTTKLVNTSSNTTDYNFEWRWRDQASLFVTDVYADFPIPGDYEIRMIVRPKGDETTVLATIVDSVTVFNNPVVNISSDQTKTCYGEPIQFSIESVVADADIMLYQWVFGDGSSSLDENPEPHVYTRSGTYKASLIVRDMNGCSSGESEFVSLEISNDKPQADFSVSNDFVCSDTLTVNFVNKTTASSGHTITEYVWDLGDETVSSDTDLTHMYSGYERYSAQLTVSQSNGCTDSKSMIIELSAFAVKFEANDKVKPAVNLIDTSLKACLGAIELTSTGVYANTFVWDIGNDGEVEYEYDRINPSTSKITHTFTEPGEYPIRLYTSNKLGCEGEYIDTIVIEEPIEFSNFKSKSFSCDLSEIHTISVDLSHEYDSLVWLLDSINPLGYNSAELTTKLYDGVHDMSIVAFTENECVYYTTVDSFIEVVEPLAMVNSVSQESGCIPLDVQFNGGGIYNPKTGKDSIISYSWTFSDGTVVDASVASFQFETVGAFKPKLTVTTALGCKGETYRSIWAGDTSQIDFSITSEMCTWDKAEFTQLTSLNESSPFDTLWFSIYSRDDTTRISNDTSAISPPGSIHPVHFDDTTGYFKVGVKVSNHGCRTGTVVRDSSIQIKGSIAFAENQLDCDNPYDYMFSPSKLIDTDSLTWNIYSYDSIYPYGNMIHTIPSKTLLSSYADHGDTLRHTFAERGDYLVELIANNDLYPECSDTAILSWVPVRDLVVDFALDDYTVCLGESLVFKTDTLTQAQDMFAMGIGYQGAENVPVSSKENDSLIEYASDLQLHYAEKGTIQVWLYAEDLNHCIDSVSQFVHVYQPEAKFSITNPSNCLPYVVEFTDETPKDTVIVERVWTTLGDTSLFETANREVVKDIISSEGAKSPSLRVVDINGCEDTYIINNGIVPVVPDARFELSDSKICVDGEVEVLLNTDTSSVYKKDVDSVQWMYDGKYVMTTVGSDNPTVYSSQNAGSKRIVATTFVQSPTSNTCVNSDSIAFEVKDIQIKLPWDSTNMCTGVTSEAILWLDDSVYFGMEDVNTIEWFINNTLFPTQSKKAQNIRLGGAGQKNITMKVTSDYVGCETLEDSIDMFVYNRDVEMQIDKDEICIGEAVTVSLLESSFLKTVPHYWLMGNGERIEGTDSAIVYRYESLPDVQNVSVKFKVDANSPVNTDDCRSIEDEQTIFIHPYEASFIRGENDATIEGCIPFTVDFINTSVGEENEYEWQIGDSIISSEDLTYTFTEQDSVFFVRLSVSSSTCSDVDEKTVTTYPIPEIEIDASDSILCDYEQVELIATGPYRKVREWKFNGEQTNYTTNFIQLQFDETTKVNLEVETFDGCSAKDSIVILVQTEPEYTGAPDGGLVYNPDTDIEEVLYDEKAERVIANERFRMNNDSASGIYYRWEPFMFLSCNNCSNPYIDLSCGDNDTIQCFDLPEALSYTVFMTDSLKCYEDVAVTIDFEVQKESRMGLPLAFSPNGDGVNDVVLPRSWAVLEFEEMVIYNRWGQEVFRTDDASQGWDGTFKGEPQKSDNYAYVLKAVNSSNESFVEKGFITLLR